MIDLRERVIAWLEEQVPPPRLRHILGVEKMSEALARHHGEDPEKAKIAGLMHDLAKYFEPRVILEMVRREGNPIDETCEENPRLLHADASAIVARDEFGISDRQILAAIANHTLGQPHMSPLSCIVYVADALEPNRGDGLELEAMRRVAWQNLMAAVRQTSDYSLHRLIAKGRIIHPRTVATRNWSLSCVEQEVPKC